MYVSTEQTRILDVQMCGTALGNRALTLHELDER
jgi:hypothetical protein